MAYIGFYGSTSGDNIEPSTDVSTAGAVAKSGITVTLSPPTDSGAVYFGHRAEMVWKTDNNMVNPGWITGHESVVTLTGSGDVSKVVGNMSQFNQGMTGGSAQAVLGYEAVVSLVDPSSTVSTYAGFYVPNASVVPNIGNIQQFSAFQSDYTEAKNSFLHPTYGAARQDLSPAERFDPVPGRFYSAEYDTVSVQTLSPDLIFLMPVHFGGRFNITRLGLQSLATPGASAKFCLYNAQGLTAGKLEADFGAIDISAGGPFEWSIFHRVEAGSYYLGVKVNVATQMVYHNIGSAKRSAQFGQSAPTLSGSAVENARVVSNPYGSAFPSVIVPTTIASAIGEPHLWYRMGV